MDWALSKAGEGGEVERERRLDRQRSPPDNKFITKFYVDHFCIISAVESRTLDFIGSTTCILRFARSGDERGDRQWEEAGTEAHLAQCGNAPIDSPFLKNCDGK